VKDILSHEEVVVHGERLKFYAHDSLNLTEPIRLQKAFDDETFEIEALLEVKEVEGEMYGLVHWRGFSEVEDTWEPMKVISADAPTVVAEFEAALGAPQAPVRRRRRRNQQ